MRHIHKILLMTAALSCLALVPGKESSAQDIMAQEISERTTDISSSDNHELSELDSIFIPGTTSNSSLKGDSFNENVSFVKYEKDILQGDTHILEIENLEKDCEVTFKSSDTSVLTVEQLSNTTCSYTGIGYGNAKITVTITKTTAFFFKDKKTIRASISVTPKAVSIMFRQSVRKISLNTKNKKLPLIIRPSISKEIPVFKSLNRKIVTVSKRGRVTAKKLGTTYITATLLNGKSAKCKILVLEEVQEEDDDTEEDES